MKSFKKLAAAALAGVMALSLLTGCALGGRRERECDAEGIADDWRFVSSQGL